MPELPEVETIVRELRREIKGARIAGLKVRKAGVFVPSRGLSKRSLEGKRVLELRRRGKYIIIDLSGGVSLVVHLRMTGRLLVCSGRPPTSDLRLPYDKHSHCIFSLDKKRTLIFNDFRRFGRILLMKTSELDAYFAQRLGPEPFDLKPKGLLAMARGKKTVIKAFLLDQKKLAGVGNIYADEALYRAKIHPARKLDTISDVELKRIHAAVIRVLKEAIKGQGTTVADFRRSGGQTGLFQNKLRVYGHAGEKCPRCKSTIKKTRLAGRGTHYCPKCQPR